jgi:hypothetical protein
MELRLAILVLITLLITWVGAISAELGLWQFTDYSPTLNIRD